MSRSIADRHTFTVMLPVTLFAALVGSASVLGQPARPQDDGRPALAAQRALAAGRAEEALKLVEPIIAKRPGDKDAAAIKVDALVALGRRDAALDAYDAWHLASREENPTLVARIARADLETLASDTAIPLQTEALEALAVSGKAEARKELEERAWANPPTTRSWPATVALGRLADAKARDRVAKAVKESTGGGKVEAIRALIESKASGTEPLLREALATRDSMLQSAAAEAAAALQLKALVPDLQATVERGEQYARFDAAVALAELGAPGGESLVKAALASPAHDVRLRAAAALKARGATGWADVVRPLLDDPDGLTRFHAARMLLDVDRPRAFEVLLAGTSDPNVAVRNEVARILAADKAIELAQLRRLLRDGAPAVRLQAARALLERTIPAA